MTGRGRPSTGKLERWRIPEELTDKVKAEARAAGVPVAEQVRRILTDHYQKEET